ncbi:hypothetical protein TYRP_019597 [Tyrophagus putrescentiae]|nr:hypothetical protein TYRP_019597 [Tyrophagus putrescentiae]
MASRRGCFLLIRAADHQDGRRRRHNVVGGCTKDASPPSSVIISTSAPPAGYLSRRAGRTITRHTRNTEQ